MEDRLLGGVEGGGTKFLAAVAAKPEAGPPQIVDRIRVDTTEDPSQTLDPLATWLAEHQIAALGIATFGPLDLTAGAARHTPKPGWNGTEIVRGLTANLEYAPPVGFDTDVSGAGLAEWRWGSARGASVALYMTVGTGIGGGAIIDGSPLHGMGHPEMGHIHVPRHPADTADGDCGRHDSCLEGMASGKALAGRGFVEGSGGDDLLWEIETHYLAHGLADLTLVLSPVVIVLGGGVMQQAGLLDRVATALNEVLGGYVATPKIVSPHFGQEAGLYGALALAEAALRLTTEDRRLP